MGASIYWWNGQSNCMIRGAAPNADIHPSYLGPMIYVDPQTGLTHTAYVWDGTQWAVYEVGVNHQYPTPTTTHSAGPAFLYQELRRRKKDLYIVGYGIGGTPLADNGIVYPNSGWQDTWFPSKPGALCDRSISTFNNAFVNLWNTLLIRDIDDINIDHGQGESDTNAPDYGNYSVNLVNMYTKLLSNLTGTALDGVPIRIMLEKVGTDTTYDVDGITAVNAAMQSLANASPLTRATDDPTGDGLQPDGHHRTAAAYRTQGIRKSALYGTMGWN